MQTNNSFDPKEKNVEEQSLTDKMNEEGVHLVNNDGTPFDNSERTYVSVDLPEEQDETETGID